MKCILPSKIEEFKKALKDKELPMADLLNLDHDALVEKLRPYAGKNADELATLFEEKRILKNRGLGLKNAISKELEIGKYSPEEQARLKEVAAAWKAKQQEKIFNPKEGEGYLGGIVKKITGSEIPKDAIKNVYKMQKAVEKAKTESPNTSGFGSEYLGKKAELQKYIDSFKPLTNFESIAKNAAIWGRNALISSPSTPIKAIENQTINSAFEGLARRIASRALGGANPEFAKQAKAEAWAEYKRTGLNTTGMENADDGHMMVKGENFKLPTGEAHGVGKVTTPIEKIVRKAAELSNKVVIDWAHNKPFTFFHQKAFFDAANLSSTDIAKKEGLKGQAMKDRALEIFKDAAKIEPQTAEGLVVRKIAQYQAARITSTNKTIAGEILGGMKNAINKVSREYLGGFPLGDWIYPIIKIPSNIIVNSLYNAGYGAPFAINDLLKGYQQFNNEETKFEGLARINRGWQGIARIIGSIALGLFIASKISADHYKEDKYGKSYVLIGNRWVNTEYLSFLHPAIGGAINAKFKGETPTEKVGEYFMGANKALLAMPGVNEANQIIQSSTDGTALKKLESFFTSRGVPVFISNALKPNPVEKELFGAQGMQSKEEADAAAAALKQKTAAKTKATKKANKGKPKLNF